MTLGSIAHLPHRAKMDGDMNHHCKEQIALIDKALNSGNFRNKPTTNGGILYPTDKTQRPHVWHYGERGYHELRRYLKRFSIHPN
jgi:hypothetical protein